MLLVDTNVLVDVLVDDPQFPSVKLICPMKEGGQ
jgi:predicted nucleic-acid-binding protein